MADSPYLVCLALISQEGSRSMPLGGRSQQQNVSPGEAPEALAHVLALELLLRIWQRSDNGPLQRADGSEALLLVELQMERLPEDLPRIKADWLNSGDTPAFKAALQSITLRGWSFSMEKFKPVTLNQLW